MNRQNLERKELRLGTLQVVGLLGLTIGSIIAAFGLGFYSGRSFAFEKELTNALAGLPKLPVNSDEAGADLGEKIVSEVYAKLNEQNEQAASAETVQPEDEEAFPELGKIKEMEAVKEAENVLPEEREIEGIDLEQPDTTSAVQPIEPSGSGEQVLLGSLNDAKKANEAKELEKTLAAEKKAEELKREVLTDSSAKVSVPTIKAVPTVKVIPTVRTVPAKAEAVKSKESSELPAATKPREEKITAIDSKPGPVAKGWYAQIAAPKSISDANAMASNLKKSGFPVAIETAEVRGEKYYRVIVGPENSKSQADVLLKQLKRESYITGDPFLRMVK